MSKQFKDRQSRGCCSEQRLQWLVRLPQSFSATQLSGVWDEDTNLTLDSPSHLPELHPWMHGNSKDYYTPTLLCEK